MTHAAEAAWSSLIYPLHKRGHLCTRVLKFTVIALSLNHSTEQRQTFNKWNYLLIADCKFPLKLESIISVAVR